MMNPFKVIKRPRRRLYGPPSAGLARCRQENERRRQLNRGKIQHRHRWPGEPWY